MRSSGNCRPAGKGIERFCKTHEKFCTRHEKPVRRLKRQNCIGCEEAAVREEKTARSRDNDKDDDDKDDGNDEKRKAKKKSQKRQSRDYGKRSFRNRLHE